MARSRKWGVGYLTGKGATRGPALLAICSIVVSSSQGCVEQGPTGVLPPSDRTSQSAGAAPAPNPLRRRAAQADSA